MSGLRITTLSPGAGYHGRRARRQAFYQRARIGRLLRRVSREMSPMWGEAMESCLRDMVVYGTGWLTIGPETRFERTYHATSVPGMVRVVDTFAPPSSSDDDWRVELAKMKVKHDIAVNSWTEDLFNVIRKSRKGFDSESHRGGS